MTIFDYLNNILFYKSTEKYQQHVDSVEFDSTFSAFLALRYCTMTKSQNINIFVSTRIMMLEKLPPKALYQFLLKTLPKQPFYRLQYVK